jgi:murein DD-endopeptidase MepM/ murein hydrolase activator NlpD
MPVGSIICAARGGTVIGLDVTHAGQGWKALNNYTALDHGDGTIGYYLHLKKDGSLIALGERVRRGQRIAASGNVGRSLLPHLHFHVTGAEGTTVPITFADVAGDAGIPRMFKRYTSGKRLEE